MKDGNFDFMECDIKIEESMSIQEMMSSCDIVHMCIPAESIPREVETSSFVVLHDSVMASSALSDSFFRASACVHMLMNDEETVVISTDSLNSQDLAVHFKELGFTPVFMTSESHDSMMRKTQLPLFGLLPLLPELREWKSKGMLTPSAQDLLNVLEKRDKAWSPSTKLSLAKHLNKDII